MMQSKSNEEVVEQEQTASKTKKVSTIKIIKTVWKVLEKIIMIAIIFISAIIITQNVTDNEKAFLGFRLFRVQTGSMVPVYNIGDVILVKETDLNKIKIEDDVTYWGTSGVMNGKIVTHRVIDIQKEEDGKLAFHTKGVANPTKDPIVYGEQINGVVQCKLHIVTAICSLVSNQYIFYFAGILPLTLFVFFSFVRGKQKYE